MTERDLRIIVCSIFLCMIGCLFGIASFMMRSNSEEEIKHDEDYNTDMDELDHVKLIGYIFISFATFVIAIKNICTYCSSTKYNGIIIENDIIENSLIKNMGNGSISEHERKIVIENESEFERRGTMDDSLTISSLNMLQSQSLSQLESLSISPQVRILITPHAFVRQRGKRESSSDLEDAYFVSNENMINFERRISSLDLDFGGKKDVKLFSVLFGILLNIALIFVWIGIIHDMRRDHVSHAVDIAISIAPPLLYSLQVFFVSLDMLLSG